MQQMNENSSQTIKELSEDKEIKNSSELGTHQVSNKEENISFDKNDIPTADSSSSRKNTDFDKWLSLSLLHHNSLNDFLFVHLLLFHHL